MGQVRARDLQKARARRIRGRAAPGLASERPPGPRVPTRGSGRSGQATRSPLCGWPVRAVKSAPGTIVSGADAPRKRPNGRHPRSGTCMVKGASRRTRPLYPRPSPGLHTRPPTPTFQVAAPRGQTRDSTQRVRPSFTRASPARSTLVTRVCSSACPYPPRTRSGGSSPARSWDPSGERVSTKPARHARGDRRSADHDPDRSAHGAILRSTVGGPWGIPLTS